MIFRKIIVYLFLFNGVILAQDTITGTYSYTYGDSESLVEARQSCKDLALREAIESYYIFVESSTAVENFQIKEEIINTISAGYIKNVQISDQQEEGRTISMTVTASVTADEIKKAVDDIVQSSRAEKTETITEADSSEEKTETKESETYPFLRALSGYEKRMTTIDQSRINKNFADVSQKSQSLLKVMAGYKPSKDQAFEYFLYQTVHTHTVITSELIHLERLEAAGKRKRARYRMGQVLSHRDNLKKHMAVLDKIKNISDWKKVIQRKWISRCRRTLDTIHKKSIQYSRK